jgi:hypothetical protein
MAKTPKTKDVELQPDAWSRFERAVDAAVKSGPKHREKPKTKRKKSPAIGRAKKPGK